MATNPSVDDLFAALQKADAQGNTEDARQIAGMIRQMQGQAPKPSFSNVTSKIATAAGPNGLGTDMENYRAGIGKSFVDQARGLAQAGTGLVAQTIAPTVNLYKAFGTQNDLLDAPANAYQALKQQEDEARITDAPLMSTKAGIAGNITGYGAQMLAPAAALRGARALGIAGETPLLNEALVPTTVRGGATQGAILGGTQPLGTGDSEDVRANNAVIGGAIGGGAQLLPRAVMASVRGLKGLIDPMTEAGQRGIQANMIRRFGAGGNMQLVPSQIPGVQPTLAEATGNPGLAQLQRTLANSADNGAVNDFTNRALANNGARYQFAQRAVGTPQDLASAQAARNQGTEGLYDLARTIDQQQAADAADVIAKANAQSASDAASRAAQTRQTGALIPGSQAASEQAARAIESSAPTYSLQAHPEVKALLSRPAFQMAVGRAKTLLANQGVRGVDPLQSVDGLQAVKMALDEMANADPATPLGRYGKQAVLGIKNDLMSATNEMSPAFQTANQEYSRLSQPINAMQVGQEILNKGTSNALDANGNPNLYREAFARALGNADQIARQETGFAGATAENTLGQQRMQALRAVASDLDRANVGATGGKAIGSNTVQNMASQSALDQIAGALGSSGIADSPLLQKLARPIDTIYKFFGVPDELKAKLTQVMLNPQDYQSQQVLSLIPAQQRNGLAKALAPYFGALGNVGQATRISVSQQPPLQP